MSREERPDCNNPNETMHWIVDKLFTLSQDIAKFKTEMRWVKWFLFILLILYAVDVGIKLPPLPF